MPRKSKLLKLHIRTKIVCGEHSKCRPEKHARGFGPKWHCSSVLLSRRREAPDQRP